MHIEDVGPWVRATLKMYGPNVTAALVHSFNAQYGANSHHTIVAKSTLETLTGDRVSPSAISNELFKNAPVSIPGRSSGEPRRKGRSID